MPRPVTTLPINRDQLANQSIHVEVWLWCAGDRLCDALDSFGAIQQSRDRAGESNLLGEGAGMALITLSRSAQSHIGQRHHQRTRRLIEESQQPPDWELPDRVMWMQLTLF